MKLNEKVVTKLRFLNINTQENFTSSVMLDIHQPVQLGRDGIKTG